VKWGLQHVKVTLEESDSGEVVVIEQSSDGHITCVPARGKGRAANSAPRRVSAESKPAKDSEPGEPAAPEAEPAPAPSKSKRAAKPSARARTDKKPRDSSLAWARALAFASVRKQPMCLGQVFLSSFKALVTKGSQWALFYELKNTWPKHIGCFRTEAKARARAQELHDAGWPASEFGPVTAGQVAAACPAPTHDPGRRKARAQEAQVPERDERPTAKPPKEQAPEREEKPPTQPSEPASDADRDKELMSSFSSELEHMLDEDEDE
jgi:hypothetical protein